MAGLIYWPCFVTYEVVCHLGTGAVWFPEHCMLLASLPPLGGGGAGALPCWELPCVPFGGKGSLSPPGLSGLSSVVGLLTCALDPQRGYSDACAGPACAARVDLLATGGAVRR